MHSCFHGCRIAVTGAMGLDYNPAVRAVQPGIGDYGDLGSRGRVIGLDSKEGMQMFTKAAWTSVSFS